MSKRDKLLSKLADRRHDAEHRYEEVAKLLVHYQFVRDHDGGSHVKFRHPKLRGPLVLNKGGLLPKYQAKQTREALQYAEIL